MPSLVRSTPSQSFVAACVDSLVARAVCVGSSSSVDVLGREAAGSVSDAAGMLSGSQVGSDDESRYSISSCLEADVGESDGDGPDWTGVSVISDEANSSTNTPSTDHNVDVDSIECCEKAVAVQ